MMTCTAARKCASSTTYRTASAKQFVTSKSAACTAFLARIVGQLVLVGHRERAGGARFDAQPAKNASQVVDLIVDRVPLAGREPRIGRVLGALNVDGVGGTGPRAKLAADALLEPVLVP